MAEKYTISVLYKVLDKATAPLRKVSRQFKATGSSLNGLSSRFKKFTASTKRALSSFQGAGTQLKSLWGSLPGLVKVGIAAMPAIMIKSAMDFNRAMANVATLMPENIKRVVELKGAVKRLAIDMGASTDDIAGGLYQVVSAFGDTADTMAQLKISAMAGKAGLATTTEALNLLSAVTKGYGDTSEKAMMKAADLAFTTVKLGQTTFPELASSIGRVVPLAAKLGVSQEELFSGFATLTGVTGNAAEVSTQYAAILRAVLKPTADMTKASKQLGFESAAQMIKQNGVVKTLRMLMKLTKGNETATAKLFGRAEALTSVFALTGAQTETYNKKLKEMLSTTGTMSQAFHVQTQTINKSGFAIDRIKTSIIGLAQTLGDSFLPALGGTAEYLMEVGKSGGVVIEILKAIGNVVGATIKGLAIFATYPVYLKKLIMGEPTEKSPEKRIEGKVTKGGVLARIPTAKTETLIRVKVETTDKNKADITEIIKKKGKAKVLAGVEGGRNAPPKTRGAPGRD